MARWTLLTILLAVGCADVPPTFVEEPVGAFPATLSEVGIYGDPGALEPIERAIPYEPAWPLWTNGSEKQRLLVLPDGARVDNASDAWEFPEGTLFFKTFSYLGEDDAPRPVETRVIRRTAGGWEYAAYRWREDEADADRLELRGPSTPVAVTLVDGTRFDHVVPNLLECRRCHESNDTTIIGFSERQLGEGLSALAEREVFTASIPDPLPSIDAPDADTRAVMGYIEGNCAHCHNGGDGPASEFSMRAEVFLENTVGVETTGSSTPAGVRIAPGSPDESVLYRMMTRTDPEAQPMPPLGVERADESALARVREWIGSLR